MVKGNTIRARHIGKDILAGLPGQSWAARYPEYTKMLAESRGERDRMIEAQQKRRTESSVSIHNLCRHAGIG